jgi:hypothetical protein
VEWEWQPQMGLAQILLVVLASLGGCEECCSRIWVQQAVRLWTEGS